MNLSIRVKVDGLLRKLRWAGHAAAEAMGRESARENRRQVVANLMQSSGGGRREERKSS